MLPFSFASLVKPGMLSWSAYWCFSADETVLLFTAHQWESSCPWDRVKFGIIFVVWLVVFLFLSLKLQTNKQQGYSATRSETKFLWPLFFEGKHMEFSWQLKYAFRMSEAATTLESLKNLLVEAVYLLLTSSFLLFFTLLFPFLSNKKKFFLSP